MAKLNVWRSESTGLKGLSPKNGQIRRFESKKMDRLEGLWSESTGLTGLKVKIDQINRFKGQNRPD
jgi:hypothetical protein